MFPKAHSFLLKNKAQVVVVPMTGTAAVTALVLFKVGSRNESKDINGASHFIEHLFFKGTKRRPTTEILSRELDSVGAEYNAYTSKDHTGYYIKVSQEHTNLALDMLADMLWHAKFDPKEIERERGVVIEEINMYEDNPIMHMEDLLEEALFGDQPLGWNIAGPRETIRRVTRQELITYRERFYQPHNMVIVLAGAIQLSQAKKLAQRFFGLAKNTAVPEAHAFLPVVETITSPVKLLKKDTQQIQVALGYPAYPHKHPRQTAAQLLATILGGTMSSRLFIQVRERRGLAYSVRAGLNFYEDVGAFVVQAGLEKTKVHEAISLIISELNKVKKSGVTAEELHRAQEYLLGKMVLGLEESSSQAEWYGRQAVLLRDLKTPEQKRRDIKAVTAAQIRQVARDIFKSDRGRLAVIGPYASTAEFVKLLK